MEEKGRFASLAFWDGCPSAALAVIRFSHSGKQMGIVITIAHYVKHLDGRKSVRNLVS